MRGPRATRPAQRRPLAVLGLAAILVASCIGGASPGASGATALTVGLGFVPSVQFAQFYLAQRAGYYRDAGLDVTLQNKIDPELITLVGQGTVDIGSADGTSVIPAVSQDIPVRYVGTIYASFPSVVFAKRSSGIRSASDLRGKRIGTPGRFGTSWIMLQALLRSAGLAPDDVRVELYPDFGQRAALEGGRVDAATGFINNEPVQMQANGEEPVVLRVDDATPLPGPGLVTGVRTLETKREALRAFVAATLHAMREIKADPQRGLDATFATVPELGRDRALQRAILDATIATWENDYTRTNGLGAIDRSAWQESVDFMRALPDTPVARAVTVDELVSDQLLPE